MKTSITRTVCALALFVTLSAPCFADEGVLSLAYETLVTDSIEYSRDEAESLTEIVSLEIKVELRRVDAMMGRLGAMTPEEFRDQCRDRYNRINFLLNLLPPKSGKDSADTERFVEMMR